MLTETDRHVIHVRPDARGRWLVQIDDDPLSITVHPTASIAERQARRRASALDIDVVLVHDRYQRVRVVRSAVSARG